MNCTNPGISAHYYTMLRKAAPFSPLATENLTDHCFPLRYTRTAVTWHKPTVRQISHGHDATLHSNSDTIPQITSPLGYKQSTCLNCEVKPSSNLRHQLPQITGENETLTLHSPRPQMHKLPPCPNATSEKSFRIPSSKTAS